MKEGKNFTQFENIPKTERIALAAEQGILEKKRFSVFHNPEIRELLKNIRRVLHELKSDHPEIVSLGLQGSLVKGYANTMSDVDAVLFIDPDKITQRNLQGNDMYYRQLVKGRLKEIWPVVENDIAILTLSKKDIVKLCHQNDFSPQELFALFWPHLGAEVGEYRQYVFEELKKMRCRGKERWGMIMEHLWDIENIGLPKELAQKRRLLYPHTLKKGQEMFLREK